jgi:hypothetical protein
MVFCLVGPSIAGNILVDKTNTSEGWLVYKDNDAKGTVMVTTGPNSAMSALELKFDLTRGNWVAWGKKVPGGLPNMQGLSFNYKGKGHSNLEIKVVHADGATFGVKIPGGTNVTDWYNIVIPIEKFDYLWGGATNVLNPGSITKLELGVSVIGDGGPGYILVSNIQYSTDKGVKLLLPKGKAIKEKKQLKDDTWPGPGPVEIGSKDDWEVFIDRGASMKLVISEGPDEKQKAIKADFTWGPREIPGKRKQTGNWVAFLKSIGRDLSEMRNLILVYRTTGAVANLEIKIKDQHGATCGKILPGGSSKTTWTRLAIYRSDFKYLWGGDGTGKFDWDHVKVLEIALSRTDDPRDNGTIAIGNINFVSAVSTSLALKGRSPAVKTGKMPSVPKSKLVIDDFADLNPANRYYIVSGDDSSLSLASSRITFSADYSMRMRYVFNSSRPTGSWVEAQRYFSPDLDWTGVESVKIWVKGDASNNIFRFALTDGEGNIWVCDNQKVLASTDWYLVNMPIENFVMYKDLYRGGKSKENSKKHLHAIKKMGIGIVSQPNRSSSNQGEIFVEKLYLTGKGVNPDRAVPLFDKPPVGIAVPLKNWNIGGTSETLLEKYPTIGSNLTQELKFKLNGNFEKFSLLGEICMKSTFGNDDDGFRTKAADMSGTNASVTILNPVDGISNIIIGNLWFDSSQHIFSYDNLYGVWGFTGAIVEGWIDRLHHRTYFLKHAPDSYTLAGHYAMDVHNFNINLIGTYYNQAPFIQSATRLEDDDKALFLDLSQKIIISDVFDAVIRLQAGYDWYQKYWNASTQTEIDERSGGSYLEGELNFSELSNIFWPGVSLTGKYRYVEPDYKPAFRRDPGYWDIEYADQKGYNLRFYQKVAGAFFSAEYDKIDRISNFDQCRERTLLSIGYNDWSALDITLTQEFVTKIYHYIDARYIYNGQPAILNEDKRENITTLYLSYHLGRAFAISEWLQFKDILQFENNEEYTEMIAVTRVSYSPAPNISFSLENKFSRYGRKNDIPTIDPNDPYSIYEYTRARIDLTF